MVAGNSEATAASDREIVITRTFNAPLKLFSGVLTKPEHVAQWWGPRDFSTRVTESDLRPGGIWRYVMIGPDGVEYPAKGVFREVVPFERIVTTDEFDEGFPEGMDLPQGIVVTVLFEDLGEKTKLTLRLLHPTVEERRKHEEMGVVDGWNSSLDCLEEYLAGVAR